VLSVQTQAYRIDTVPIPNERDRGKYPRCEESLLVEEEVAIDEFGPCMSIYDWCRCSARSAIEHYTASWCGGL